MPAEATNVGDYLKELERSKKDRPEQVRDAIDIYIDLWKKVIERGIVLLEDDMNLAVGKVDARGGLYQAAEGESNEK